MKIIILGAGQVGSTVAERLAREDNDITVVDHNVETLRALQDRMDIRTVTGHASYPSVLSAAGARDADMIVAVTDSDETNMVACQVAYTLFHTTTKIARVRSADFLEHKQLFAQDALPVDVLISPEQLVTNAIQRLIETPGALQVLDFAGGRARLVAVKAYWGGPLVGHALRELPEHMPGIETRVAAIFRNGLPITPVGDTVIEVDDEVFFVAASEHIRAVMGELRKLDRPVRRVMLAGGGNIGRRLARALENTCSVKLIEHSLIIARELSEVLDNTIVLQGDAADENLLREENIEDTDVFCAVTNDDQINILSAMLAKRLAQRKSGGTGAERLKVMALINRPAYVDLVQDGLVDIAISPQQTTVSSLLAHVRRGDVVVVHSLRRGAAEAIEAVAHGDERTSKVVGRKVEQIKLPPGTTIDAVVRGDKVIIAHHDTVIEADDHVILFLTQKSRIRDVERLFQVGVTFI